MQIQMLKMAAVSIYNSVSNKFTNSDERSQILDPITTLFKLCIISFKTIGIKISISNNKISYQEPGFTQGLFRWSNGDKANDLHNLQNPINMFINDSFNYQLFISEDYIFILNLAINGLKKLKISYTNNPIIKNSINHYIEILEKRFKQLNNDNDKKLVSINLEENDINNKDNDINNKDNEYTIDNNSLYNKFKEIWNKRQVSIIVETLRELNEIHNLHNNEEPSCNKTENLNNYILSLSNLLDAKDKTILNIIKEIFAGH